MCTAAGKLPVTNSMALTKSSCFYLIIIQQKCGGFFPYIHFSLGLFAHLHSRLCRFSLISFGIVHFVMLHLIHSLQSLFGSFKINQDLRSVFLSFSLPSLSTARILLGHLNQSFSTCVSTDVFLTQPPHYNGEFSDFGRVCHFFARVTRFFVLFASLELCTIQCTAQFSKTTDEIQVTNGLKHV